MAMKNGDDTPWKQRIYGDQRAAIAVFMRRLHGSSERFRKAT